jgi:hypothetical protein
LNGQKLKFGAGPEVCYAVHLFVLPAVQHPFNLQCDNYHTLQIKGTQNTPVLYDYDKTNAPLLGPWLKQWNVLGERCNSISLWEEAVRHNNM